MKKILFISYYWPPSGGAGVQRSLKFVKYLSEYGIEPIVLTVDERYASYPLTDDSLVNELPLELKVVKTKSVEALKLLSLFTSRKNIPHGGFANSNKEKPFQKFLRYLRGNFFIPDARIGWIRFAKKAALEIIRKENIDTVYITSPPHSSQLIGLWLKKKMNLRWIADLRDPWTDIYFYKDLLHSKNSGLKDARYEAEVLHHADEIIAVSAPINELFLKKSPTLSAAKFHIIPNGYDASDFSESVVPSKESFYITYVGSIADSYKPDIFFEVFEKAIEENSEIKFRLRFVGSMPESIRQLIGRKNLESITEYLNYVDHAKAVRYMQEATALLLLIPDVPDSSGILTGKLFEYLASRRPVIGLGPSQGDAAAILNECNAGKMFDRTDEGGLSSYLKSLILQWKENNKFVHSNEMYRRYSRNELTRNLASLILKEK